MATTIQAIDLLKDQARALDSAMLVAQTAAEKAPVHKLRTTTRRVEAQLVLLEQLPGLPEHTRQAAEVHRLLRRVRRAAANVRDLDVQTDAIVADMPDSAAVHDGTRGDQIRREARKLLKKLLKRRKQEAADLVGTLHAESEPLSLALRAMQEAISGATGNSTGNEPESKTESDPENKPASTRRLTGFAPARLSEGIQTWFATRSAHVLNGDKHPNRAHALQRLQHLDEPTLHDLRKAAKQCRYMAESLPEGSTLAKKLADRFEYLQEAGGQWHDWLMLEEISARLHGKNAALTQRYRNHRDAALAEYHLQLALEFTTGKHGLRTEKYPHRG